MTRIAAIVGVFLIVAQGAARAKDSKVSWMKLDVAQQFSSATGKPILAYAGFT
jgi:hypothetical protein